LDRYVGWGLSHVESHRAIKALRQLWNVNVSQALRRTIGGFDRFQQAQVLFAFVREYEAGTDKARLLVEGQEAPESLLRSLRLYVETRGASRRSGEGEQHAGKHPDAVQLLPRLLALDSAPAWAGSGWEDAVPRVAHGIPARSHRLRALGNAVVPAIPELLGRAYLQAMEITHV
jgi:hypothetical protein